MRELRIELERPTARFTCGETVRGSVVLAVDAPCRCDELSVELLWHTHGKGDRTSGPPRKTRVFAGDCAPGAPAHHPFELQIPPGGPVTYDGTLLNVAWALRAEAVLHPGSSCTDQVALIVVSDPNGAVHDPGPRFERTRNRLGSEGEGLLVTFGCGLLLGVPPSLGLALASVVGLVTSSSGGMWLSLLLVGLLFAGVLGSLGGLAAWSGLKRRLSERSLGPVHVEVPLQPLRPSEAFEVVLGFTPRRAMQTTVTAVLRGREDVTSKVGSYDDTQVHTVHTGEHTLRPPTHCPAGVPVEVRATLTVPDDAPPTFEATNNALRWQLHLTIARDGADWELLHVLHVRPA